MQLQTIGAYETKTHLSDLLPGIDGARLRHNPAWHTGGRPAARWGQLDQHRHSGGGAHPTICARRTSPGRRCLHQGTARPGPRLVHFVLNNPIDMPWLLRDGSEDRLACANKVLDLLDLQTAKAVAPSIWALEAVNVSVKAQVKALVTEARTIAFTGLLSEMRISTAESALGDTLQLARRFKLSSYDAAHLKLVLREAMLQTGGALI